MTFSDALVLIKNDYCVQRAGWNGKGMYLALVPAAEYTMEHAPGTLLPWIGMKTADGCFVPWLASQTDILADDWQKV